MFPLYRFHITYSNFAFHTDVVLCHNLIVVDCPWAILPLYRPCILLTFGFVMGPAISMKTIYFGKIVSVLCDILFCVVPHVDCGLAEGYIFFKQYLSIV